MTSRRDIQRRGAALAALLALELIQPASLRADRPPDESETHADEPRERFKRGVELYRDGSYDAALAEFQRAYALSPDYRVLYNLAQVQAERHEYVAGMKLLDDYLAQGSSQISESRMAQVASTRARLERMIATLWVISPAAGAEILVDGLPTAKVPLTTPLMLNAGVHRVQLRKPGYETAVRELTIAGSETVHLEFALAPEHSSVERRATAGPLVPAKVDVDLRVRSDPPAVPLASERERYVRVSSHQTPMWVALMSTAVLTGAAATFGALVATSNASLARELSALPADRERVAGLESQLRRDAALLDTCVIGAVISAGAAVYFALSPPAETVEAPRAAGLTQAHVGNIPGHRAELVSDDISGAASAPHRAAGSAALSRR